MRTPRPLLAALIASLMLAACGGSDPGSDATTTTRGATPTTSVGSQGTTQPSAPQPGEAGVFTVNETEFVVTLLNRCIPFQDEPGNIDLQALAQGQGAQLNLYLAGGTTEVSVQGSGIQQAFGSIAFGEDPEVTSSEVSGNRWTGSATVGDSMGSGDAVDLSWDIMVPEEARDCSL